MNITEEPNMILCDVWKREEENNESPSY